LKKNTQKYLPLIIGAACALGVLIGSFFNFSGKEPDYLTSNTNKKKLEQLIDYINHDYVDEVNTDSIVDVTIASILKDLDPHSTYIPKSQFTEVSEQLEGDFVGIGVQFYVIKDTVAVIRTIEGGPGEKAGIRPGDRLIQADEESLIGKTSDELQQTLRGKVDSKVNLKVHRPGHEEVMTFQLNRSHIPLASLDAAFMLDEDLGYIKLNRFSKTTYSEFKRGLDRLKDQGAQEIVLDLRDNGGGYLKEAMRVADECLEEGKLILKTKDKKGKIKETFATAGGDFIDSKVYVLINQSSASASEVIAGALQDNDIGTIVGQRSFGKGLVQREMQLGDGSAVRLTVARYYTPTGRSIQRPYKNDKSGAYFHESFERYKNGELTNADSIHVNDSLKFTTPKGKTVYGGGGIIPDVFVPKDVSYRRESLNYMLRGGVMERFIFNQLDKERTYYGSMTVEDFKDEVFVSEETVNEFIDYLKEFNVPFKPGKYEDLLKLYLKATMAQQLFGSNEFEQLVIEEDPMIQKVLELHEEILPVL